jgi:hypothetical protein
MRTASGAVGAATEEDGIQWERMATQFQHVTSGGYSAIAFQGKIWVFGNEAWSSPDGNSWTRETGLDKHIVQPVVFADMVFGFQEKSLFYFTAQSVSWKKANPPSLFSSRYGATAAAFKNKIWLIGGTTNDAWSWGWE